jgi:hypothetical protein
MTKCSDSVEAVALYYNELTYLAYLVGKWTLRINSAALKLSNSRQETIAYPKRVTVPMTYHVLLNEEDETGKEDLL